MDLEKIPEWAMSVFIAITCAALLLSLVLLFLNARYDKRNRLLREEMEREAVRHDTLLKGIQEQSAIQYRAVIKAVDKVKQHRGPDGRYAKNKAEIG